jgi:hypothetical protein
MFPGMTMATLKPSARTDPASMPEATARAAKPRNNLLYMLIFSSLIVCRLDASANACVALLSFMVLVRAANFHPESREWPSAPPAGI